MRNGDLPFIVSLPWDRSLWPVSFSFWRSGFSDGQVVLDMVDLTTAEDLLYPPKLSSFISNELEARLKFLNTAEMPRARRRSMFALG